MQVSGVYLGVLSGCITVLWVYKGGPIKSLQAINLKLCKYVTYAVFSCFVA